MKWRKIEWFGADVDYSKTSSYHWPLIGGRKYNYALFEDGKSSGQVEEVTGPFGFGDAVTLGEQTVSQQVF